MFSAKLEDIFFLRDSIAAISELIDETELHIKKDGMELLSADRAVIAVISFSLSKEAFNEYNYERDLKFGINLLNFLQILRRAQANDVLRLSLLDNKLQITLEGDETKRNFVLPLIDVSKEDIPDLTKLEAGFSTSFNINSETLNSGIDDAELITDSIVFTIRREQLNMKADSDSSSMQLELPTGSDVLKINEINEPVRARYSIDYLKKIMKARKLSEEAKVEMATDYPIKISYEIQDKLRLSFILAPRVEE